LEDEEEEEPLNQTSTRDVLSEIDVSSNNEALCTSISAGSVVSYERRLEKEEEEKVVLRGVRGRCNQGGTSLACLALIAIITKGEVADDGLKQFLQLAKLSSVARASEAVSRGGSGEGEGVEEEEVL